MPGFCRPGHQYICTYVHIWNAVFNLIITNQWAISCQPCANMQPWTIDYRLCSCSVFAQSLLAIRHSPSYYFITYVASYSWHYSMIIQISSTATKLPYNFHMQNIIICIFQLFSWIHWRHWMHIRITMFVIVIYIHTYIHIRFLYIWWDPINILL